MCFFFKQKTAYEIRISDWSSDVCSSDLGPDGPNVAPFSFFQCVGVSPPMVIISCSPKTGPKSGGNAGVAKDTIANLRHHPEFVVHIVDYALRDKMNKIGRA